MRCNAHVHYMPATPDLPDGGTCTVNTGERALSPSVWHASGLSGSNQPWGQSEEAEAPAGPVERKGKGPPSGRPVCRTHQSPTGTRLHRAVLVLGATSQPCLNIFLKMYFQNYPSEH